MKKITPFVIALFAFFQIHAATYTAVMNGNWNVGATWGTATFPGLSDNVIIPNGKTVTVVNSVSARVNDLTINAGGKLQLNWALLVYGNLINSGTVNGNNINVFFYNSVKTITSTGTWTLTGTSGLLFYGNRIISAGTNIVVSNLTVVEGSVTVTNNGTLTTGLDLQGSNAASKFINGATGTLIAKKAVMTLGILDASAVGNTVVYAGAAQNIKIPSSTYCNLTIQGSATKTLLGNTSITGNFLWTASAFNMANFNFNVGGNWTNTANVTATNMATVTFTGTGTITRTATEIFNNLTVNTAGTHTLGKNIQVNGNVLLTAGTFDASASNFGITCKGNWTNNGGVFNGRAGTVTFNNINQTINGTTTTTFGTLTANCSGTLTLGINTAMNHDFNYLSGAFNCANFNLSVGGNWSNTINTTLSNMATVTFTGTGTISRPSTEIFNNLTVNTGGTHTLARDIQVNGNVTLTAGTFDVSVSNFAIVCKNNWTNNGGNFIGRSGGVTFNNVNHTINGTTTTTFNNLVLSHSGTVTLGINTAMNGDFDYNSGLVNCANFNLSVGNNWNNTANTTLSNMATVTFTGSAPTTINRTSTELFNNITINRTSTISPAIAITASGTFTVANGTFDVTASNFPIQTKDFTETGGTFNAQAGTLTVTGNFSHSAGTFTAGTGTVLFNGALASTIGGASNTQFNNLTLSNAAGVSLTAAKTLTNTMTLTVGNFNTGGFDFTLTSTAAGTARIAAVPAGSNLLGATYVIQRLIPGPATGYWDDLCSPVTGTTLARWDNVTAPTAFFMSGTGGNDGNAVGSTTTYPPDGIFRSCRKWLESISGTSNLPANCLTDASALVKGTGYETWVSSTLTTLNSSLLYDSKGSVGSTTVTIPVVKTSLGYNMIGNPMPSQILWSTVFSSSSNLTNQFLIIDETLQNYALWNGASGTGHLSGSGGVINSSQGFIIRCTANTNVVIPESAKTAATTSFTRMADPTNIIRVKLSSTLNEMGAEELISFMNDASDAEDNSDMPFIASPNVFAPSLKIMSSDNQELLSSNVNAQSESHEIPLKVSSPLAGTYTLSFDGIQNFNNYNCIYLQDNQTGKTFNLKKDNSYSFLNTRPGTEMTFTLYLENEVSGQNNFACRFETNQSPVLSSDVNIFSNEFGFNLDFNFTQSTPVTIEIYNTLGESVAAPEKTEVMDNTVIVGANLIKGLYIVRVTSNDQTITKELIHE